MKVCAIGCQQIMQVPILLCTDDMLWATIIDRGAGLIGETADSLKSKGLATFTNKTSSTIFCYFVVNFCIFTDMIYFVSMPKNRLIRCWFLYF